MKTRFGYVSNSSSSSFVLYGEEQRDAEAVARAVAEGRTVVCVDENAGWSGDCGDFVFKLTPERLSVIGGRFGEYLKRGRFHALVSDMTADDGAIQFVAVRCGKSLFRYNRDDCSPSTDASDDEDFSAWLGKGTWRTPAGAEDRPMKIGRRITLEEAERRVADGNGVVFVFDDSWAMYVFGTSAKSSFDRLVKACPVWLENEECFFLESLDDFRSGDRIDLDGTYICASAECFVRMPNVKWMERCAEKYQGDGADETVLPEE